MLSIDGSCLHHPPVHHGIHRSIYGAFTACNAQSDTRIQSYAIYTPMLPCPKSHLSASEASYSYTLSYACSSQPQNAGE
jgi:hypothetical protein